MDGTWKLVMTTQSSRQLKKLDRYIQKQIIDYMHQKVLNGDGPRSFGKPLQYHLKNAHRFRVDDWRVLCTIHDEEHVIRIFQIDHRSKVYGGH